MQVRPYGGYYNRPPLDSDGFLTRVGPGTPCGEYLRRYWHPFMLSSEVKDLPVAVKLLGEELVIFRDGSGRVGLLHRQCVHRGTSLEFGIPQQRGIRCCYHGWHFDIDGTILDTPAEPPASRIRSNFAQGAYPVHEAYGLLFAYLGPPELKPEFPVYDCFDHPEENRLMPFNMHLPCNWLQVVENGADPMHNAFLHAIVSGEQFSASFKVLPVLDFPETPIGYLSMATRRVNDFVFIRASDMMLPNVGQFPNGFNTVEKESFALCPYATRWAVPVDDENSLYIGVAHVNAYNDPQGRLKPEQFGVDLMPFIGQTDDRPYEERQRQPGDYDALAGQGRIVNRKAEHLGTTDRGVVLTRRMLTAAINAVQEGKPPASPKIYVGCKVPTYAHETVVRIPSPDALPDAKALSDFGRRAALAYVETEELPPEERAEEAARRIRALFEKVES